MSQNAKNFVVYVWPILKLNQVLILNSINLIIINNNWFKKK